MQIVSEVIYMKWSGENKKKKKSFKMMSTASFTQHAKR